MHTCFFQGKKILITSQSKKETENFIQANLTTITQVPVFQETMRTVLKT